MSGTAGAEMLVSIVPVELEEELEAEEALLDDELELLDDELLLLFESSSGKPSAVTGVPTIFMI